MKCKDSIVISKVSENDANFKKSEDGFLKESLENVLYIKVFCDDSFDENGYYAEY